MAEKKTSTKKKTGSGTKSGSRTASKKSSSPREKTRAAAVPEEDLEHIFERFYRVDKARGRETGGTGLGLSIVKQMVKMHDGTISVTSNPGKGSEFVVTFPQEGAAS